MILAAAADVLLKAAADTDASRKARRRWRIAAEESSGSDDAWCSDDVVVAVRSLAARDADEGCGYGTDGKSPIARASRNMRAVGHQLWRRLRYRRPAAATLSAAELPP